MAQLECPRCKTRFDPIFASYDHCPYCLALGLSPPPILRRQPDPLVSGLNAVEGALHDTPSTPTA